MSWREWPGTWAPGMRKGMGCAMGERLGFDRGGRLKASSGQISTDAPSSSGRVGHAYVDASAAPDGWPSISLGAVRSTLAKHWQN